MIALHGPSTSRSQFDLLCGKLTGREHLHLFAALKGLEKDQWEAQAKEVREAIAL